METLDEILSDIDTRENIDMKLLKLLNKYLGDINNVDIYSDISELYVEDKIIYLKIDKKLYEIPFKWIKNPEEYWKQNKELKKSWYTSKIKEVENYLKKLKSGKENIN